MYSAALLLNASGIIQYVSGIPARFVQDIAVDAIIGTCYFDWLDEEDRVSVEQAMAAASVYDRREYAFAHYQYRGKEHHSRLTIDCLSNGEFLILASHVPYACRFLTDRQKQVLAHSDETAQKAAREMGVKPSTIDSHRSRLRAILGARCDCDLCCIACRLGLLTLPG